MRQMHDRMVGVWCTVVVQLKFTDLELTTTASHAFDILSGRTPFAPSDTAVFDLDGQQLTYDQLKQLRSGENH